MRAPAAPPARPALPRFAGAGWHAGLAAALVLGAGCRSRPAPPAAEPAPSDTVAVAPIAVAPVGVEAAPSCAGLRLVGPTAPWPSGADGPAPDPLPAGTPRGYYVQAPEAPGAPVFSLRPLLDRAASGADPIEGEVDPEWDRPRFTVEVTPGYRLDGAPCDRIGVADTWGHPEHEVEGFGTLGPGARSLSLADSLGRAFAVLPALGEPGPSPTPPAARTPPRPRLQFDADPVALVAGAGRLPLADVFPHGRWRARPVGVRYRGSDLVLVNSCVPYDAADGFCGLESEDGTLVSDPPSPLVATVGVRVVGDSVRVEPFSVYGYWGSALLRLRGPYPYEWSDEAVPPRTYALRD